MVTVQDYAIRKNADGEDFVALILQGGIEMVQSEETGNYYATTRKASVTSTFDEATARSLIGREIPGQIVRVECEPYVYIVEDTGEQLTLTHTYEYQPEGVKQATHIAQGNGVEATV